MRLNWLIRSHKSVVLNHLGTDKLLEPDAQHLQTDLEMRLRGGVLLGFAESLRLGNAQERIK